MRHNFSEEKLHHRVWQSTATVEQFLTGVRGGIPFAQEQINVALRIIDQVLAEDHNDPDHPSDSTSVLHLADLGCGDGVIAHALLMHYPHAQVTALDFSTPMLEQAKQRLQEFRDRVTYIQADLYNSDWQTHLSPCDVMISGYCIHHLPDHRKQRLYQEIFDFLKPGGCFINIEHVASASPQGEALFDEILIDALYDWQQDQGEALSRDQVAEQYVHREDKKANILAPVEVQCDWLRHIGFQQVDCYFKFFELAVFGGVRPPFVATPISC